MYDQGLLDKTVTFDTLRQNANINERAFAAEKDLDFSEKIRTHF